MRDFWEKWRFELKMWLRGARARVNMLGAWICFSVAALAVWLVVGLAPAEAKDYKIIGRLEIPEIGLMTDVAEMNAEGNTLPTPATIVGSFSTNDKTTLLYGHAQGVFGRLDELEVGEMINYKGESYEIISREVLAKGQIDMRQLLAAGNRQEIVVMTCAGTIYADGDASHRLIVRAVKS